MVWEVAKGFVKIFGQLESEWGGGADCLTLLWPLSLSATKFKPIYTCSFPLCSHFLMHIWQGSGGCLTRSLWLPQEWHMASIKVISKRLLLKELGGCCETTYGELWVNYNWDKDETEVYPAAIVMQLNIRVVPVWIPSMLNDGGWPGWPGSSGANLCRQDLQDCPQRGWLTDLPASLQQSSSAHRSSADWDFGQPWALSQQVPAVHKLLLVCWGVLGNFLGRKSRSSWGFPRLEICSRQRCWPNFTEVTWNIQAKLLSRSGLVEQSLFMVKVVVRRLIHNLRKWVDMDCAYAGVVT